MALRITIDAFSGWPNPTVVVTGMEERDLLERLAPSRAGAALPRARRAPAATSVLGYRGLIVERLADDGTRTAPSVARARGRGRAARAASVPLRVAHGMILDPSGARPVRDVALESFVTSPAGPFRAAGLDARLLDHLAAAVERARSAASVAVVRRNAAATTAAAAKRCACAPLWDPGWWNDGGPIQSGNNCYNYAVDHRSDTYAQPGRANGALYATVSGPDVRAAALADGLLAAALRNRCPGKGHLVALCVSAWDFHWYRKQRSGNWTHKPGPDPITQLDNAGLPITDPRNADRGPYTQFVGFLTVLHGRVKIG